MSFGDLDPGMMLSTNFSLADLTQTSTGLPNLPEENSLELRNLGWLADMLEQLGADVGAFTVLSGFRTHDVQQALTDRGEPTNPGAKSFHEAGLAVDIAPAMGLNDFYGKLASLVGTDDQPGPWYGKLSEIALKPSQNAIHLALAVPGTKQNVFMALNSVGVYAKLTADEVMNYAQPFLTAVSDVVDTATKTPMRKALVITAAVGGVLLLYLLMSSSKHKHA